MDHAAHGRLGGLKRTANLSPERRSEIARQAVLASWEHRKRLDPTEMAEQRAELVAWFQRTTFRTEDLADALGVSLYRAKHWRHGTARMPPGLLDELLLWERELNADAASDEPSPRQRADLSEED